MNGISKSSHFIPKAFRLKNVCDHWPKTRWFSGSTSAPANGRGPVRVRFAPSPTGQLHLGGFRTALVNYLYVVKNRGQFILRIEDTDQTRLVPTALESIETDLRWLGIVPAEGPNNPGQHGPYIQSQRLSLYQEYLSKLSDSGHGYECFCTEKRLDLLRREAQRLRQKPRYDNKCRDLTREEVKRKKASGEKFCVRFKLTPEQVVFNDLVYGRVEFDLTDMNYEGDPVIMKSDGFPTYHYANVVDDHCMEITHVLRGIEWQISTPKHLQMYKAFKWDPPEYAHLPLVLNKDGTKLSKRQGDISISHFRNQTYYATALANFVTKSGGGFSNHSVDAIYSMEELAASFELNGVNTGGCRLDFLLLEKLNQLALSAEIKTNFHSVSSSLAEVLKNKNINLDNYSSDYLLKILNWCSTRVSKLQDLASADFDYLWSQPSTSVLSQVKTSPDVIQRFVNACVDELYGKSEEVNDMQEMAAFLERFTVSHNLKQKAFFKDLRTLLCGLSKGPPIVEIFHLFGKDMILSRLNTALEIMSRQSSSRSAG